MVAHENAHGETFKGNGVGSSGTRRNSHTSGSKCRLEFQDMLSSSERLFWFRSSKRRELLCELFDGKNINYMACVMSSFEWIRWNSGPDWIGIEHRNDLSSMQILKGNAMPASLWDSRERKVPSARFWS